MDNDGIGLELRSLNILIKRYFQLAASKNNFESITCINGWIIGFLSDNQNKDVYQKDIEDKFTITRSTASKVLSLMEQKGLIERKNVTGDGRLKKIVITDKALKIREGMLEDAEKMEQTLLDGFSQKEISQLGSYLKRMKKNISRQENE